MIKDRTPKIQLNWKHLLVLLQFLTAATLVISTHFSLQHGIWLIVSVLGMLLGLWSIAAMKMSNVSIMPDVKPETQLMTAGPYRIVRHPMYSSLMLFCGGFVFAPFHWWKVATWFALTLVLTAKSCIEERQLTERFLEYADYSKRTFRFVPFFW